MYFWKEKKRINIQRQTSAVSSGPSVSVEIPRAKRWNRYLLKYGKNRITTSRFFFFFLHCTAQKISHFVTRNNSLFTKLYTFLSYSLFRPTVRKLRIYVVYTPPRLIVVRLIDQTRTVLVIELILSRYYKYKYT